jgi:hypothetical protein
MCDFWIKTLESAHHSCKKKAVERKAATPLQVETWEFPFPRSDCWRRMIFPMQIAILEVYLIIVLVPYPHTIPGFFIPLRFGDKPPFLLAKR